MHLLMLAATFFWAGNIIAIKEGLAGFTTLALTQLRITFAGIIFIVLFLATGKLRNPKLSRRDWVFMFFIGLTGVTLNQVCFIAGLDRSSASHAGLIVALGPIMVLVLSCTIGLEALTGSKFAGMLIAFGGVAVLATARSAPGSHASWVGDLILLAGSGFFAVYTILVKEIADKYDAVTINAWAYVIGVPLMLPFAATAVRQVHWGEVPAHAWWGLAYAILFGSVVPYLLFALVLTELTAARVAAFSYFQPAIATGLGVLMLHERLSARLFIGGAFILGGLYLTERERGDEQPAEAAKNSGEEEADATSA
jgi:drug/metabolite transporter (DMT)-like permease